jgi:predicted dehydrogenase
MKNTRRNFLKEAALGTIASIGIPYLVPSTVFGKNAPSNRINIGAIGTGRISRGHDMPGVWKYNQAQIMAVCDLDLNRVNDAKKLVNEYYSKKYNKVYDGVKTYSNYFDLLNNKDIDAILVSTPDHWHSKITIDAIKAKKDVYLQKPASLTIAEGQALVKTAKASKQIVQIGSQQRSSPQFRYAAELVRNGRIGTLKKVIIGLPYDPAGDNEPEMPIPTSLNYDMWLGSTPEVYYTEKRVHPNVGYDRPGWLRCEQFGAGMITGWGAHHIDSAHWAMNKEYSGPIEIKGWAEFPKSGLWNVHGSFETTAIYDDGVEMVISDKFPNGVRFEGTEGWIFVTRGNYAATASDPVSKDSNSKALDASDPKILTSVILPNEINLIKSDDHHGNWLESIKSRKAPIAPIEVGHRSCSACLLHHVAMKLKRPVFWDPKLEVFKNDPEATAMLSRPMRNPYQIK